ncbi:restriction endonuclease subunit S [Bhargavaea beijingensis]|uniref:restriction endonuclease subunit S n=1 Tax=Bhargavaea beijingensis TaxID=426756 RepID=UPI0022256877|nr:restriction endonuclease subunit S [Bhargavaea beijingensis]MCW1929506.1 restriction endonuclease subunit S [Bhargavaea beijingensis]
MKNNIPEIRFPGFNEDWEQRMLGDIFSILDGDRGKNYPGESDFNENGATLFLDTGNVKKNGFDFSTKKYITKEKDESLRNGKLELYDFVLTSRGTLGNVAYYDEKTKSNYPSVRINSAMLILRPAISNQVSDSYMAAVLRGNIIKTFMSTNHVGSAQPHITKRDFSKVNIGIPSTLEEQNKIGLFFKHLDDTINLHQQELTTLKQTKQGFLQKMFPKEGQTVPEVRFPGFTAEWKESTLGEIVTITMGQSPSGKNYTNNPKDYILVQGNADIKNRRVVPRVWTTQVTKLAQEGDIILSVRAPVGDVGKTQYDVVLGRGVAGIKGNEFIYQALSKMKSDSYWNKYSTGSTFESINSTDIKEANIKIPEIEEQNKIGEFFKQLDETIELHEKELEVLKETKKAFLQKMFV